jgi:hypothetical protein
MDGENPGYEIAEMTHSNYTRSYFFDLCKEADRVAIFRCSDFNAEYIERMISYCRTFCVRQYDTVFDIGIESLYCSELVYQADFERRLKVNLEKISIINKWYVSPTALITATNVTCIWDSNQMSLPYPAAPDATGPDRT